MKKMSEPIVFFGSGPVAAQALELLTKNFNIEIVVTKPKPAHHKGNFPVLDATERLNLPTLVARNKRELSDVVAQHQFKSRVAVLVDFGIIVTQDVINAFPLGIINSHFSLLPEWRGADPITFAILSGQKETGVSLMLLVEKMDEGPLLAQAPFELSEHITTPELTADLIELSDHQLQATVPLYVEGKAQPALQEQVALPGHDMPSYSRKLTKEDGMLDWRKPAEQLEREVRAFQQWPKSYTTLAGIDIVVTKVHVEPVSLTPGEIKVDRGKQLIIGCAQESLGIDELKPAGRQAMSAAAFLAGYGHKL